MRITTTLTAFLGGNFVRMLGPDERLGTAGEGPLLRAAPCQTGLVLEGSSQFWQGQFMNVPVSSRGFQSVLEDSSQFLGFSV